MADETTGPVTSRADALRVVEHIERLLDGGHWTEADELYVTRCGTGQVFRHLPAAGLGQRAAGAFVATPDRRAACSDRLSPDDLSFYLNDAGLHTPAWPGPRAWPATPPGPSSTSWPPASSNSPATRAAATCTPTAASGGPNGWPAPAATGPPSSSPTTTRPCAGPTAGTTRWPAANASSASSP